MILASVSKQFTAAAMMRLIDLETVGLNALVTQYVRDSPYADVTIRHLRNQTSGIPDVHASLAKKQQAMLDPLTNAAVAKLIQESKPAGRTVDVHPLTRCEECPARRGQRGQSLI